MDAATQTTSPASKRVIGPQPGPQTDFLSSDADIIIFGGGAGGTKSYSLLLDACRYVAVPKYAAILFRRTSVELRGGGSLSEESWNIFPYVAKGVGLSDGTDWTFQARRGGESTIKLSHLQHDKDVHSHQGKAYAYIGFDELTHFTEDQFWYMLSRNRSMSGVRPMLRGTCNPDPDSFVRRLIDWWIGDDGFPIKERSGVIRWLVRDDDELVWFDSEEEARKVFPDPEKHSVKSFTFIASLLDDNPILLEKNPEYRATLMALPRVERERLLGGNWNVRAAAGDYFRQSMFTMVDAAPAVVAMRTRGWDLAASRVSSANMNPDWTVGVKYSRGVDGRFYVEHMVRIREAPLAVEQAILNSADVDGTQVQVSLWQDPGAAGKAHAQHLVSLLPKYVVHVERAAENKVTYAKPVSSQAEAGNIYVVRGPWNADFFRELESFPPGNSGHDDIVDALSLGHLVCANSELEYLRRMVKL